MRVREIDILIVPGGMGSGPDHWQSRWERKLSTARRVVPAALDTPTQADLIQSIARAAAAATRTAVIVAHGSGVLATTSVNPNSRAA